MQTLGGVTLGVEIVGAEVGVKSAFAESTAAADEWAKATQAAGIEASRGINFVGLSAAKAELAYGKFGETILATNAKIDKSLVTEAEAMKLNQEAAVRYMSTTEGLAAKQAASSTAAAAAAERGAFKYQAALIGAGRTMTTYLTLPLAIAGYASIKLATDFQASMTRIRTYAGATQQEVNRMSDMILRHAGQLPQGPIVSSEAVYHLESIGIRGKQAFDALRAASIATGAGMADLTDATTALGGALVSTIKGASDAKTAMAGLVAIAGMGNMTMQDLSNALGTGLLAKAANVGVPLRDIGSALAVLVDRGIPARRSATYLGTTLALMAAPSKVATNALSDMGINANNMATMLLHPNGLLHVLDMLHAGMEKVGRAQGARDLMEAFGRSRQSTGIITLVESMNSPISSYSAKLQQYDKGVADAAERMAAYQQTAQYKIHTALSQLEADFIKLGQGAAPGVATAIKGIAGSINSLVNEIEKLPGPIKDGLGILAAIMAVGGPLVLGVGVVLKLFTQMGQIMGKMGLSARSAATETDSAITSIGTTAAATTTEVMRLQAALDELNIAGTVTQQRAMGGGFLVRGPTGFIGSVGAGSAVGEGKLLQPTGIMSPGGEEFLRGPGGQFVTTAGNLPPEILGSELAPAETAFGASLAAGLKGVGSDLSAVAGRAMQGGMFALGGMMAGSMVESMVPGRTGQMIGQPLQMAGIGAGIGTMIEPGIGTGIGAGVGLLAGGIMDLIHSGPSLQSAMQKDATAIKGLSQEAHQAALTVSQLQLSRLQIMSSISRQQQVVQRDETRYLGTEPGTAARAAAVRQLREAQLELKIMQQQLKTTTDNLTNAEKNQNAIWAQRKKSTEDEVKTVTGLRDSYKQLFKDMAAGNATSSQDVSTLMSLSSQQRDASNAVQAFAEKLIQMAQTSTPHMATVLRDIAEITLATNKMPTAHQIKIMLKVSTEVDQTTKNLFRVGADGLLALNLPGLPGYVPPPGKTHHDPPAPKQPSATQLSNEQAIQVALAKNPNDKAAVEAQIRYDEAQIQHLKRLKAEGQITASQYVTQVSSFYSDLRSMEQSLKSTRSSTKGTSAFDKKVRDDNLLAKARLDLENGQYVAAQKLLAEDKARLEIMLREAKNSEERNAVLRQLLEIEKLQKSKEGSFALSMKLQEEMARANAIAALDPSLQGPTSLQMKLAREAKAQAMKAINSHNLTMQGLIDAWDVVGQANATLAQRAANQANLYHKVSTDSITDAVAGLTASQEMQLRERMAQSDAHRGHAPNDQGAATGGGGGGGGGGGKPGRGGGGGGGGRPPVADAPRHDGASVIRIDGTMNFYGVQNIKQLEGELEKIRRQKHGRAGARR